MIGYSTFNSRPFVKDYLFAVDHVLAPGDMKDGIVFEESVNDGEELVFGSCIAGKLEFTVDNADGTAPNVTGKEYRWRKAVEVSKEEDKALARFSRIKAVCGNGSVWYVSNTASYLSIYNAEGNKVTDIDSAIAPAKAPEGLYLNGGVLYCLYSDEPYVTAYFVSETGFEVAGGIELADFQIKQVKRLAKRNLGITMTDDGMTEWLPVIRDGRIRSVIEYKYEWVDMGYFIAEKPEKLRETKISVTAYDRLIKFDAVVDDWLTSLEFPITLSAMLDSLCNHVGVQKVEGSYTNGSWAVREAFTVENITGREILQYIAQANAGFCRMRADGLLELTQWQIIDYQIDNSIYNILETAEFLTDQIDKVQLKVTENDIGVIVGTGTNAMVIQDNPLLYGETDSELRPVVTNIYNYASIISYQPFSVEMVQNPLVRAGDIFSIISRRGETVSAYVMNRTMKGGLDTFEATGDQRRSSQTDSVNRSIQALRGRIHEIVNTIDEFSSTISDLEGNYSKITQTINQISFDVYDAEGDVSARIAAEVEDGISSIELSADQIKIQGTTTLSDIFTAGTTTISGDHIDTGSIKLTEVYFKGSTTAYLYSDGGDIIMYPGAAGGDIFLGNPTSTVYTEGDLEVNGRFDADGLAKVWGEFYVVDYAEFSDNVSVGEELSADSIFANTGYFEDWCWAPDWTNGSDRDLKHDIADVERQRMVDFVVGLRPVKYRLNSDDLDRVRYGFIAQEVQETLQLVGEDEGIAPIYRIMEGLYGLNYTEFIAPMVSMMQEMWQRITRLEEGTS